MLRDRRQGRRGSAPAGPPTSRIAPPERSRRRRIGGILLVGVVLLVAMIWSGSRAVPSGRPAAAKPAKVVIFGIPKVGLYDLAQGRMPVLSRLAAQGSIGAGSIRTPSDNPSTVEAYATLGAGVPVIGPAAGADARMANERIGDRAAAELGRRRLGTPASGQVVVLGGPAVVRSTPQHLTSQAGALGTALRRHGRRVAVLGNADRVDRHGDATVNRPAAVALMNGPYWLNAGNVRNTIGGHDSFLQRDPAPPLGVRSAPSAIGRQASALLRRADVLVVDPGDTDRAVEGTADGPAATERRRTTALAHTDEALGSLVSALPPRTLLLVVGVTPPTNAWDMTPMVAYGPGVPAGYLVSPSTHRLGVVLLTDVAPTVLSAVGLPQPPGMTGSPFRYQRGRASPTALVDVNSAAALLERMQPAATLSFIVAQVVVYLGLILCLVRRRRSDAVDALFRWAVLVFAAWPLATYAYRMLPEGLQLGANGQLAVWALAGLLAAVAGRFDKSALVPLQLLCGVTVAVILADVATGARLQLSSILGYNPQNAGRFTGLGNLGFAVLASTAIVAGLVHVHRAAPSRRSEAIVATGVLFALVVAGDGWATLGGDVGGTLTLLPVLGASLLVLSGRKLRARTVLLAAAGALALAATMTGLDVLRPAAERTHLGRFAADAFSDHGTFWTVLARKWTLAVHPFRVSIWTWAVPVISLVGVYALVVRKAGQRLLPAGSALRVAVTAILLVGVVGGLLNDSGVAITAMTLTFVGPLLALLALDRPAGRTEVVGGDHPVRTGHLTGAVAAGPTD